MQQHDYDKMVNKNALQCWSIIVATLLVAYMIEVFNGNRTFEYYITFAIAAITPLALSFVTYVFNPISESIKYQFAIGYCLFYTFVIVTSQSAASFIYFLPMISTIVVYCDCKLIIYQGVYLFLLNIVSVIKAIVCKEFDIVPSVEMTFVFWEIQLAAIVLSVIFMAMSARILAKRHDVINDIVDDVYQDPLTKLHNVRFLKENSESLFKLDMNKNVAVAFIDIDDFKKFNTKYGHSFGDKVLRQVADIITNHIQGNSLTYAVRNGGDEFVIVSRTMNDDDFISMVDKIREDIAATNLSSRQNEYITIAISAGIATKSADGIKNTSFQELYDKADARNQNAKEVGKNTIISCD